MRDEQSSDDAFVIRWPHDGTPVPEAYRGMISGNTNGGDDAAWLEDTRDGSCVFTDGMEPEDAILCRDLRPLVDIANAEAAKVRALLAALEDMVRRFVPADDDGLGEAEIACARRARAAIAEAKGVRHA